MWGLGIPRSTERLPLDYIVCSPWFYLSRSSMPFFAIRRARLRPEYAELYPRIASGIWLSARGAAHAVRRELMQRKPHELTGERLLPDEHFDFRGGRSEPGRGTERRTRTTDCLDVIELNDGAVDEKAPIAPE
jgi:hypothetical protein